MINIENQIITKVSTELSKTYKSIEVSSEEDRVPASFPFVSIIETDNYTYSSTIDSGSNENHVQVTYTVNVYSNKTSGKKSQAKKIMSVVDEVLLKLGFTRSMLNPVSMNDATICRYVARYSAVVSKDELIYRR